MSLVRPQQPRGGKFRRDHRPTYARNSNMGMRAAATAANYNWNYDNHAYSTKFGTINHGYHDFSQNYRSDGLSYDRPWPDFVPYAKRRKISALSCESNGILYQLQDTYQNDLVNHADLCKPPKYYNAYCNTQLVCDSSAAVVETRCGDASAYASSTSKRDRSKFEDDEVVFMSRDEIEKCSPSRKDGIDPLHETHLRYSYCSFLQDLGVRLDL